MNGWMFWLPLGIACFDVLITASMLPSVWRMRKRLRHAALPPSKDPEQRRGGTRGASV